jgi:transcriptional regulator GlxA family with amidase domain
MLLKRATLAFMALLGIAVVAAVLALPASRDRRPAPATVLAAEEQAQIVERLRPPKRTRPVVAVVASNGGTETTDFIVPYGVLAASRTAEVVAVAPRDAPVELMPALRARPQATTAAFDARYPDGADYVIVPALHDASEPAVLAWIRAQADSGAILVGVCEGGWVLAAAGLLDGRAATTHWFSAARLRRAHPRISWTPDRRYVVDGRVVTTTGVSASIPVSLAIVEAIAGRESAAELADELGVARWDAGHASALFVLDRPTAATAASNLLSVWSWETVALPLRDGVDEVALALTADAYARTFRTKVRSVSSGAREVATRRGLTLIADSTDAGGAAVVPVPEDGRSAAALDRALDGVGRRYGEATADFVALQLEYPR